MAQTGAVVGKGRCRHRRNRQVTATIVAIDPATREITLKDPKGKEITLTAGPEVKASRR
jgi:hypothetical protein